MDNKQALEMVNKLIEEHKRDEVKSALGEFLSILHTRHMAPLKKAIEEVQEELRKVDPTSRLPGTLLDKDDQQMGAPQNLNPDAGQTVSNGIEKAAPSETPSIMHAAEGKHDWKGWMGKCMKTLTASQKPEALGKPYASAAQRGKFHAMEERGEISPKVVHEFDEASKGKKLPEHVAKAGLGGTGTGAPSTPTSRPNAGFGAVIAKAGMPAMGAPKPPTMKPPTMKAPAPVMKDDKPHPPGSPEERSHAVAEGMVSLPKAAHQMNAKGHEATERFFNHLRTLSNPQKRRSAKNNLTVSKSVENPESEDHPENKKPMSADTKSAITASADKPMKVQPNRPGQANKP